MTGMTATHIHQAIDRSAYALLVLPEGFTYEKIAEESTSFRFHYGSSNPMLRPHVLIAGFRAREDMEETLTRWIQNICGLHSRFTVTLNNFSGFPPEHIYIRIQDPAPLQRLGNGLRMLNGFLESNNCPPLDVPQKPCMNFIQELPAYQYDSAIAEYAQKIFHGTFMVEKIFLWKRNMEMSWQLLNCFVLPANVP